MASNPPSGASRFRDTICFCTSSLKRSTLSVSGRMWRKPKVGTQLGNSLYLDTGNRHGHKITKPLTDSAAREAVFLSFRYSQCWVHIPVTSLFLTPRREAATQIGSDARCSCWASRRWRGTIVQLRLTLLPFSCPRKKRGHFEEPDTFGFSQTSYSSNCSASYVWFMDLPK